MYASPAESISLVVLALAVFAGGAFVATVIRWKGFGAGAGLVVALLLCCGILVRYWSLEEKPQPASATTATTQATSAVLSTGRGSSLSTTSGLESPATVLDFRSESDDEPAVNAEPETAKPAARSDVQPSIVEFNGQESIGRTLEELPSWVNESSRNEPDRDRAWIVLASGQFATIEEAETDLVKQAVPELQSYLTREYPAMADWQPPKDLIRSSGVIARRVHQTRVLEIGEFEEPMHRVYWMLELRPGHRETFFSAWRPQAVRHRLAILGGVFGGLTLLLGGVAAVTRREPRRKSTGRPDATAVA